MNCEKYQIKLIKRGKAMQFLFIQHILVKVNSLCFTFKWIQVTWDYNYSSWWPESSDWIVVSEHFEADSVSHREPMKWFKYWSNVLDIVYRWRLCCDLNELELPIVCLVNAAQRVLQQLWDKGMNQLLGVSMRYKSFSYVFQGKKSHHGYVTDMTFKHSDFRCEWLYLSISVYSLFRKEVQDTVYKLAYRTEIIRRQPWDKFKKQRSKNWPSQNPWQNVSFSGSCSSPVKNKVC